jgi:hypothetical protein
MKTRQRKIEKGEKKETGNMTVKLNEQYVYTERSKNKGKKVN